MGNLTLGFDLGIGKCVEKNVLRKCAEKCARTANYYTTIV